MADEIPNGPDSLSEKNVTNPVEYSKIEHKDLQALPLNSPELYIFEQQGSDNRPNIIGLFLAENDTQIHPAGHLVVAVNSEDPTIATLSVNYCATKSFQEGLNSSEIPENIKGVTRNGNVFNALEIYKDYSDKKIGGSFFKIALQILSQKGIKTVQIIGDVTIGKKETISSFYTHLGAEVDETGNMIIDLSNFNITPDAVAKPPLTG